MHSIKAFKELLSTIILNQAHNSPWDEYYFDPIALFYR